MSADELDIALQISHLPAMGRLSALMSRVNVADLTPLEVLAMLAVLEAVDARVNGDTRLVRSAVHLLHRAVFAIPFWRNRSRLSASCQLPQLNTEGPSVDPVVTYQNRL
jgi:hypothetical protein